MSTETADSPAQALRRLRIAARMSLQKLAKEAGYRGASSIQRYEDTAEFPAGRLPLDFVEKVAPVLIKRGVSAERVYALAGVAPPKGLTASLPARANIEPSGEQPLPRPPIEEVLPQAFKVQWGARDLPVFGKAECGDDGHVNFPQDPIEWFWRPPELVGVRDAFAMYAAEDSMTDGGVPAGTLVFVQKHRAPTIGRLCLVLRRGEGAFIKQFRGRKNGKVVLYQSNPPKVLEWPDAEVEAVYRIVGTWDG